MIYAEESVDGMQLLLPPVHEIFWSAIFLGIFALVFLLYVMPRMNAVLDERAAGIRSGLEMAEQMKAEADQAEVERERSLAAARQEAAEIREKARQDGVRIVDEAKTQASSESERILSTGRQQLSAERMAASAQLRTEVGDLASDLASKIVGEALQDDDRSRRVIDRFLDDLEAAQPATR